jgi:hypothetical protein
MLEAVALSLAGQPQQMETASIQPPDTGISFAHMARMGYAATGTRPSNIELRYSLTTIADEQFVSKEVPTNRTQ